jgi:spermidine synthase
LPNDRVARLPRRVWVGEDEGQTALLIDGVVQSVVVGDGPLGPGYWPLMLPDVRPNEALVLGLGGGTLVHLLARRFPGVRITGVENDPAVIRLGRSAFGLDVPDLNIVEADAFEFMAEASGPYEYVAVDLWADGAIPRAVFQKPFLRRMKDLLAAGGVGAINFFKDRQAASRLRRIEAIFPRVEVRRSRENYVAVCRPR